MYGGAMVAAAVEAFLPSFCAGCGAFLAAFQRGLCGDCWSRVRPLRGLCCSRCGGPGDDPSELCSSCCEDLPPQAGTAVWGEYSGVLRQAVLLLKHHGHDELARPLGRRLGARVALCEWSDQLNLVGAVPSHPWHRVRRGWTAAELLAREVAHGLDLPYDRLVRRRHRSRQAERSRAQRLHMPADAFSPTRSLAGKTVLVVDDVTTTGTTLRRAARTVLESGARTVYCAALAYSPESRRM